MSVTEPLVERDLIGKSRKLIKKFSELQVGMVIPDIMMVTSRADARIPEITAQLSLNECAVAVELDRKGPTTISALAKSLFSRPSMVERAVFRLIKLGIAQPIAGELIKIKTRKIPVSFEIISVEAKLLRWGEAIQQAVKYKEFSDAAYVALPNYVTEGGTKIKEACIRENIGLIAVSPFGQRILFSPRKKRPEVAARLWIITKALSAHTAQLQLISHS